VHLTIDNIKVVLLASDDLWVEPSQWNWSPLHVEDDATMHERERQYANGCQCHWRERVELLGPTINVAHDSSVSTMTTIQNCPKRWVGEQVLVICLIEKQGRTVTAYQSEQDRSRDVVRLPGATAQRIDDAEQCTLSASSYR